MGLKGKDLSDKAESDNSSSELSDSVFDMKSDYRKEGRLNAKSFKKSRSRKGSTLSTADQRATGSPDDKLINISGEAWQRSDFYELDSTVELVQNSHEMSQNGKTRCKHKIKYAKTG